MTSVYYPQVAAFLANVGVNASHLARSPIEPDGRFALLPIPETGHCRPPMLRLRDLTELAPLAPRSWWSRPVHLDPDLGGSPATYGDNCETAGRAYALRQAATGDVIAFLARLHGARGPGFFLVGVLHVDAVLEAVGSDPGPGWWDANAHVRRARAGRRPGWNRFWVFRGDARSRLLTTAVPFRRQEAESVFGPCWNWRPGRTELQTIGSYTRAVRRLTGAAEARLRELAGA